MQTALIAILASTSAVAAVVAFLIAGRQQILRLMDARAARFEDSLRVYSNANTAIGRHVTALEAEVRELRARLEAMERAGPARERSREPAAVAGAAEASMDPERRLSQLIRSRLGELRAG